MGCQPVPVILPYGIQMGQRLKLQKFNKILAGVIIGGKETGYEAGKLSIGIYTNGDISRPHEYGKEWEIRRLWTWVWYWCKMVGKKLFKSTNIWDKNNTLGKPFVGCITMPMAHQPQYTQMALVWKRMEWLLVTTWSTGKSYQNGRWCITKIGITGDGVIQKIWWWG